MIQDGRVVDHGPVDVDISYPRRVHVHHRAVVAEGPARPHPAPETDTTVAKTVVDAAVEADMGTPIARMPGVYTASQSPIARGPQHTHARRRHPHAGYPVVAHRSVGPVPGSPKHSVSRT